MEWLWLLLLLPRCARHGRAAADRRSRTNRMMSGGCGGTMRRRAIDVSGEGQPAGHRRDLLAWCGCGGMERKRERFSRDRPGVNYAPCNARATGTPAARVRVALVRGRPVSGCQRRNGRGATWMPRRRWPRPRARRRDRLARALPVSPLASRYEACKLQSFWWRWW